MKIDIFYISKYGATKNIGEIIENRLKLKENYSVSLLDIKEQSFLNNAPLNIVLTPIYGGFALKEFDDFLSNNQNSLLRAKNIIFAIALNRPSCFDEKSLKILKKHPEILPSIIYQEVLHGKRVFEDLDQEDKNRLLYFYKDILKLSQEEIKEKQAPANFISQREIFSHLDCALDIFNLP